MTAPGVAAVRFWQAVLLGCALGAWYGILRPLRPRRTTLSDGLFTLGAAWIWLVLAFDICAGDLRIGYFAGVLAGGFIWELTVGRLLRPIMRVFWRKVGQIGAFILLPAKKILKIAKILFASGEKWVTIKWNNRRHSRRGSGGPDNGRKKESVQRRAGRLPPQQAPDQSGRDRGYRVVYGSVDYPALDAE